MKNTSAARPTYTADAVVNIAYDDLCKVIYLILQQTRWYKKKELPRRGETPPTALPTPGSDDLLVFCKSRSTHSVHCSLEQHVSAIVRFTSLVLRYCTDTIELHYNVFFKFNYQLLTAGYQRHANLLRSQHFFSGSHLCI